MGVAARSPDRRAGKQMHYCASADGAEANLNPHRKRARYVLQRRKHYSTRPLCEAIRDLRELLTIQTIANF